MTCRKLALWLSFAPLACGPKVGEGDDSIGGAATGAAESSSETGASVSSTSTTSTSDGSTSAASDTGAPADDSTSTIGSSSDDGLDSNGFIVDDLHDGWAGVCDAFVQDCARGEKCMPATWALEDGTWDHAECVVVTGDGAPGEPCTVEGGVLSGHDDFAAGAMCWNVDAMTNMGTCVALCTGSGREPTCTDAGLSCEIVVESVFGVCVL